MVKKLGTIFLLSLTVLLLILVLPLGEFFVTQTKEFLSLLAVLLMIALTGVNLIVKKTTTISLSPLTVPLVIFGLVVTASIFFTHSHPVDNILGFGGVYLSLVLIVCLGKELVTKKFSQVFMKYLGVGAALMSLLSILQSFGYKLSWIYAKSPIVTAQILGVVLVGYIFLIANNIKKGVKTTLLSWVVAILITAGFGFNIYSSLPGKPSSPSLPSLAVSWSVALDTVRNPKTAALGVGPNNYHLAYAQFKPVWTNQTKLWNVQLNRAYNLPLTLLTSAGILGFIGWLLLVLQILKQVKYNTSLRKSPTTWMLLALLATQLVLPPFTSLLILFGLVLTAWLSLPEQNFTVKKYHRSLMAQILGIVLVILFVLGSYALGRTTTADYFFYKANQAGQTNKMVEMYQLQQRAVNLNPFLAIYHRRYALTNISLATALANKADPTQEDQENIVNLIQQSIRESQTSTQLQPADVQNWQVLAQIYNNLAGTITGADQWAVNSYVQAIQNSPTDPELRIALGSIFYGVDQFDQAEQLFAQAITLKPDHANAHYNLANALAKQDKLAEAIISYENVLSLVEPSSENYKLAAAELATIQTKLD